MVAPRLPFLPPNHLPRGYGDIVVVLLFVGLHAIAFPFIEVLFGKTTTFPKQVTESCLYTIVQQTPIMALVLFLIHRSKRPWGDYGIQRRVAVYDWMMASIAFTFFMYFAPVIVSLTDDMFGQTDIPEFAVPTSRRELPLFIVEMLVIGFSEELIWRSYIQTRLRETFRSSWQAVFATSLLFGIVHLYQGFSGVVSAFLFGVIVGSYFEWRRMFIPIALGHAAIDFFFIMMAAK